ncbi:hypothetical protein G6L37_07345 [Agrobacterium rubi]|nr:hypothetical protein [Agrobacterium rubi]NTF25182.1 hypothetical protein [Agrobacterium rubi]
MTDYIVYFRHLSEEQRADVNRDGWSSPVGTAYLDSEGNRKDAPEYTGAVEFDLFEVAAVVRECADRDELWSRMQNRGANWACEPTVRAFTDFPRSMSTGDVIHDTNTGEWSYAGTSFGFPTITDDAFIDYLRGKTTALGLDAHLSAGAAP